MTKKLENLFDLPADLGPGSSDSSFKILHDTEVSLQAKQEIQEQRMDPRFGGQVFQTAGTLLGHAITAKTAKMDKKLRMVQLQLQKAKLDHQTSKDAPEDTAVDGQGVVLDRNALLDQILQNSKK